MPKLKEPYQCDFCEQIKLNTNNWFIMLEDDKFHSLYALDCSKDIEGFRLFVWDSFIAENPKAIYICSQSCAFKALAEWLVLHQKTQ